MIGNKALASSRVLFVMFDFSELVIEVRNKGPVFENCDCSAIDFERIIIEVIDDTYYNFDSGDCVLMSKKFRNVYVNFIEI